MKRGGMLGVMDSISDALVGKHTPELGKDQEGNTYIKQHTMTRGEQWRRIAGEAMMGAAAGYAAGQGAGGQGRAAMAGIQMQQQQADRQAAQMDKKVLDDANNQMLRMKFAEQAWKNTRLQVEATQHDLEFSQGQEDRLTKSGATNLGVTTHPGDLSDIRRVNPDLMKDLVNNHSLEFTQHYTDGKPDGFTVWKTPQGYGQTMLPAGSEFPTFNSVTGQYDWHQASEPMTQAERDDRWTSAGNAAMKWKNDKAEQDLKAATKTKEEAQAGAVPSEIAQHQAEAAAARARASAVPSEIAEHEAQARAADARANAVKTGANNPDGTPNPMFEAMAQSLYTGDLLPKDLKRQAKGMGLDPNALMGRAVEIGNQKGQPWSETIIEQENRFAQDPKVQAALDGIDRIVNPKTGYMQQMLGLARDANLTGYGFLNSPILGVRRAFGETTAKNMETAIAETRRSIGGLIGNPLLGGGETDKKLEQAKDMLGGSPTMENLEGAAKILDSALQTQRTSMIQNNRFLQKRYGTAGITPPAAPPAAGAPPPGATHKVPGPDGKNHWTNDQGTVDYGVVQ
jgi:hypothetical protein